MGSSLSYRGDQVDFHIIEFCQELILCCIPAYQNIYFKDQSELSDIFNNLTIEQISSAFSSQKMQQKVNLEILQKCNIAFNDPELIIFINSLLHDKTFFALNQFGVQKRYLTKALIDKALKKHLTKVMPKEFHFLIQNPYFLKFINVLFLPLQKHLILSTIEQFFEFSGCDKNPLYDHLNIHYEEYEKVRHFINLGRKKYLNLLIKYKNDPEYQVIRTFKSFNKELKKSKTFTRHKKSLDDTNDTIDELFMN